MSLNVPEFKSDIPEPLFKDVSPQDKWMMETMSVLNQKTSWLADAQNKQNVELEVLKQTSEEIKVQTTKTNGRVTNLEAKNVENVENLEELEKIIMLKKIIFNKWSLIILCFAGIGFFVIAVPWVRSTPAKDIVETIKMIVGK